MRELVAIGYKGKILKLGTPEEFEAHDRARAKDEPSLLSPIAEIALKTRSKISAGPILMSLDSYSLMAHLELKLDKEYREAAVYGPKRYGPFGDAMFVIVLDEFARNGKTPVVVNWIAQKAFHKPALAADLVIVVKSGSDGYFVGIKRKNPPGKGKFATIGGFLDVRGYRLGSPLETAIHEACEEVGMKITDWSGCIPKERELLSSETLFVRVVLPGVPPLGGELLYIGVVETGKSEKRANGLKRVYWTFGYVLRVALPNCMSVNKTSLAKMFTAGDDAASIHVKKVSDGKIPDFGISHHRELFEKAYRHVFSKFRV